MIPLAYRFFDCVQIERLVLEGVDVLVRQRPDNERNGRTVVSDGEHLFGFRVVEPDDLLREQVFLQRYYVLPGTQNAEQLPLQLVKLGLLGRILFGELRFQLLLKHLARQQGRRNVPLPQAAQFGDRRTDGLQQRREVGRGCRCGCACVRGRGCLGGRRCLRSRALLFGHRLIVVRRRAGPHNRYDCKRQCEDDKPL